MCLLPAQGWVLKCHGISLFYHEKIMESHGILRFRGAQTCLNCLGMSVQA